MLWGPCLRLSCPGYSVCVLRIEALPIRWFAGPRRPGSVARLTPWLAGMFLLLACAGPKPVLYPNDHYQSVGAQAAEQDIAECRQLAESAGAKPGDGKAAQTARRTAKGAAVGGAAGAVGGAIVGAAGTGAAVGAASSATAAMVRSVFSSKTPSQAYMHFVDRCLWDRGYELVGWN